MAHTITATPSDSNPMRDLDAELHEQYETQFDAEHGAQLIQARVDADIAAKLRAWRDAAHETDPIV